MGYPSEAAELDMLESHGAADPIDDLDAVADAADVRKLIEVVRAQHVSEDVRRYVVALLAATRTSPDLRLGASPRSGLQLVRVAKAHAALDGRDHVLPDDVQDLAPSVLAHRLLATPEAQVAGRSPEQVVDELVARVPVPTGAPDGPRARRR
jgi:MoxR-like ATPase